ncbi:MAG: hypothetical protein LBK42_11745 [Propionibacteriaceae bacterium]|jgi:hypothetical protein|nr:hypothetical protein [Propionibacteriaceae bacterium]
MTGPAAPPAPVRPLLDPDDQRTVLRQRVENALLSLPGHFEFDNPITGVNATDLFSLNSLLGTGIEIEVVRTLNQLRALWDPEEVWAGYRFERSSQAFPDVRLVRGEARDDIAIGVELKGWWLLSKEGVPSLRYQVSPAACAPHDLICVVPWHLSNAVSGVAAVIEPWIESAWYAAEYRDYWWQHLRSAKGKTGLSHPQAAHPYPNKADLVLVRPQEDGGGNFGRLPRAKPLMEAFIARSMRHEILGIPVADWVSFLKLHSDTATPEEIGQALEAQLTEHLGAITPGAAEQLLSLLAQVGRLLSP